MSKSTTNPQEENPILPNGASRLYAEAKCGVFALITIFLAMLLFSYSTKDSCWSHVSTSDTVVNLCGRFGAWIADALLFIFGFSAWWLVIFMVQRVWVQATHVSRLLRQQPEPPVHFWRGGVLRHLGFIVVLATSTAIEYLRLYNLPVSLPDLPGGIIGQFIGKWSYFYLDFTASTLVLLFLFLVGFSFFVQVSWLQIAEGVGTCIEVTYLAFVHMHDRYVDRRIGQIASSKRQESIAQEKEHPAAEASAVNSDEIETPITSDINHEEDIPFDTGDIDHDDIDAPVILNPDTVAEASIANVIQSTDDTEDSVMPEVVLATEQPAPPAVAPVVVPAAPIAAAVEPVAIDNTSPFPPLSLLDAVGEQAETVSAEMLESTSRLIEKRLGEFGVTVRVVAAYPGPVVTRYEIEPATGVKGNTIVNLARDLARSLSLVSIRVIETIPGKTYMGLELPNMKRQIVHLTEILSSSIYQEAQSNLTIALGKDIAGKPVVADLARMPHLLIAGTTGSGKSVGINATILSLLYKATPEQVRLILIDPKMLELSIYEGIPHLLAPVITDMSKAGHALNWAVAEMEKRYKLMSSMGVRNLASYNQHIAQAAERGEKIPNPFSLTPDAPEPLENLPQIVIIVDEFADLMMVVGKKVEELIARIAQKARAAGIHLILATQRPSVDVITGLIKANVPTRIAFQVSSKIDSRTILDQTGAETLLGLGDMLYLPPGTGLPIRVHGAFVSDDEVHRVVTYLKQQGHAHYVEGILDGMSEADDNGRGNGRNDFSDELYDQAVEIVLQNRRASISLVQRHLRIGYNRAARLLEQMEHSGLVSAMQSNGNREILVPDNR